MMFWYGHGMSGWGYVFMATATIVFWGLVIAAVVVLARYLTRAPRTSADTGPERILAERFARGEIDEQEYRSRLTTLRGGPRSAEQS
ncbi:SHOCT domain-containing protein [Actinophytocola sp.]|uniref:SHOCT domain-containing protein n=1 Tax=Actinophytocola sp. TaxID=1872138 RepID=UPI00389A3D57